MYGSGADSIMDLPILDGIKIINKMYEQLVEDKIWKMYLAVYPNMTKENFVTFEQFKDKMLPKKSSNKTKHKFAKTPKYIKDRIEQRTRKIKEQYEQQLKDGGA